jgi:phosphatidylserine/phosphatidylglycerophosphate/cardiolipin synthase-like enzyme
MVYLEVYMLTETRIKQSLINASKRWVVVKVLLEKNPYKANNINNKHFKFLKENWVNIRWSNPDMFSLNHSKFIIIDDALIISTWNFTYSTFNFNRDLFLFIEDSLFIETFHKIFKSDFEWYKISLYDENLVLSPNYSREKFEKLFSKAKKSIYMYFQYLSDEKLEELLIKKALLWVNIEVIVSRDFSLNHAEKIRKMEKSWIKIKTLKKIKMHSKAILIDNEYLFIWSINFSSYSLDKNREVGVLLKDKDIISKFIKLFSKDFAK